MKVCAKCQGRLHIKKAGKWIRCACLMDEKLKKAFSIAGIETPLWDAKLEDISGKPTFPVEGVVVLHHGDLINRAALAVAVLRNVAFVGGSIYAGRLHDHISAQFKDGTDANRLMELASCLWLRMDHIRKHAWNDSVLSGLISQRMRKEGYLTIITCFDKIDLLFAKHIDCARIVWKHVG